MAKKFLNYLPLIFLIIFSFLTRFYHLDYPPKVVFDEAHFGLYATKYLSHQYYLDVHPPLGKLIFGLVALLSRARPGFDFAMNSEYGDFKFLPLRATTAFFSSLFVILIYLLIREMGFSQRAAFLAGFFVLFDNAILVQSRLILIDIILLFFIFLSLFLYILVKKTQIFSQKWYFLITFLGISLGAAISIKLVGFGILGLLWFWEILEEKFFLKTKKEMLVKFGLIFLLPIFLYFLFFVIHLQLLPQPCQENCGQVLDWGSWKKIWPEITQIAEYRSFIAKFNYPPPGNLFYKILEIHRQILRITLSYISHYWESDWYSWPFMVRPICYFWEKVNGKIAQIYFWGNPLIWWFSGLGFLAYLYLIVRNFIFRFKMKLPATFYSQNCRLLLGGYLFFFAPFAIIPRFLLLYHYLPALTFSIIIFSIFVSGFLEKISSKVSNIIFFGILILVFLSFFYFLPLSYGLPLSELAFRARRWLSTWGF